MHAVHHDSFPRSARPFDHYVARRRHPAPQSFAPPSVAGYVRQHVNPSGSPRPRGVPGLPTYRVPAPGGSLVSHVDYVSQSPRPSVSYYQLEYSQGGVPMSWAGPPVPQGVQMAVQQAQDRWLGPPPPMYAIQQSPGHPAPEAFPSSPMYAQYGSQMAPPPNYGTSQPQYSPVVAPPTQQVASPPNYGAGQPQYSPVVAQPAQHVFVVANAPVVPPPPTSQFAPAGQPTYQYGFVPTGQPVANQAPAQPQQEASSGVASPPQQYVLANQPLVVPAAPANQPYVAQPYAKAAPPSVMPQQFIMMPAHQYVVSPQPAVPAPQAGQVCSVVANQNAPPPRPNGPPPCVVQPVMAGQRMPIHVAAMPNQFQPIAVPASQLQMLPANQLAVGHLQVVPANALQVVSTNQPPPLTVPANQMQSSQQALPPQPVYCYLPSASVASLAGAVPASSDLGPAHMPVKGASSGQQPAATAGVQV